jgi:hypothetical protein
MKKKEIKLSELKPGPIQHEQLPKLHLDILHWTFRIVGHYIQPTLEQWELGFMRDTEVTKEVALWHRITCAFITYHRRKGLPLRSDKEEKRLLRDLIVLSTGEGCNDPLASECYMNPDGFDEESKRIKHAESESTGWSPSTTYADWPNKKEGGK